MKQSTTCPKCHHDVLLHVREVTDLGHYWRPAAWFLATTVEGKKSVPHGQVEAFACRRCGFTEFYTQGVAEIPVDGNNICEIRRDGERGPPYR